MAYTNCHHCGGTISVPDREYEIFDYGIGYCPYCGISSEEEGSRELEDDID